MFWLKQVNIKSEQLSGFALEDGNDIEIQSVSQLYNEVRCGCLSSGVKYETEYRENKITIGG